MKKIFFIMFLLFLFVKETFAKNDNTINCHETNLKQNEIKICNDVELSKLDVDMNKIYKSIIKKYNKSDKIDIIKKRFFEWKNNLLSIDNDKFLIELAYEEQIKYLTKLLYGCDNFNLAINLIGKDNETAKNYFSNCIYGDTTTNEEITDLRNESKIYLAYLYLSDNKNEIEANKLIKEFIKSKNCDNTRRDNFCAMDNLSDKIKQYFSDRNQLLEFMQLGVSCFSYNMAIDNNNVLNYAGSYFGSTRDNFIATFCDNLEAPYKILSISSITKQKNYKYIKKEKNSYEDSGTIRFAISKNKINLITKLSIAPDLVLKDFKNNNDVFIDISLSIYPSLVYFKDIYNIIKKHNDLLNIYNKLVLDTQEYYYNVLKLDKQKANLYGRMAVDIMILEDKYK